MSVAGAWRKSCGFFVVLERQPIRSEVFRHGNHPAAKVKERRFAAELAVSRRQQIGIEQVCCCCGNPRLA
jgi:hypothetical protein